MPTKEEIDGSPYHEKLQRPAGSATSRDTNLTLVRSQSASSYKKPRIKSATTSNTKKSGRRRGPDESEMVSRVLRRQLEDYINKEKREQQFSTNGIVTTTKRMEPFDVAYRLIQADHMERASPRNPKSGNSTYSKKRSGIDPYVEDNSRRITQYSEIDRLVHNANSIYQSLPIEKLTLIHRYRPHPEEEGGSTETGKVQGYHRHFGAALHAQRYVDFYSKSDLDSGNPSCRRLKKLPKRKPGEEDESFTSSRRSSRATDIQDRPNNNKKYHEKDIKGSSEVKVKSKSHKENTKRAKQRKLLPRTKSNEVESKQEEKIHKANKKKISRDKKNDMVDDDDKRQPNAANRFKQCKSPGHEHEVQTDSGTVSETN